MPFPERSESSELHSLLHVDGNACMLPQPDEPSGVLREPVDVPDAVLRLNVIAVVREGVHNSTSQQWSTRILYCIQGEGKIRPLS
jgi:hypothetical protein